MWKASHWSEAVTMQKNTYKFIFQDLGKISYKDAWDYQEKLFGEVIELKLANREIQEPKKKDSLNYLLFCEHPHVFTLGKSGNTANLLVSDQQLKENRIQFFNTNRGGDITYHGPGQIVGYPIFDLEWLGLSIHDYIHHLEESVILTIAEFGITGERLKGATGVWIDPLNNIKARKICSIGVKASRWVTMHGLALNVNTDLSYFNLINPCGFKDKAVTSLAKETGNNPDSDRVKQILKEKISQVFGIDLSTSDTSTYKGNV